MPAPDFISPFVIQPTRLGILNAVVLIFSVEKPVIILTVNVPCHQGEPQCEREKCMEFHSTIGFEYLINYKIMCYINMLYILTMWHGICIPK
jgi:hypothetical protein